MYITVKNKINALHYFFYEGIFGNDIYNETLSTHTHKKKKKKILKIELKNIPKFLKTFLKEMSIVVLHVAQNFF